MKDIHSLPVRESAGKHLHSQTTLPYRVLVVEDDIDIRRINAEVLQRSGYFVDTEEDGEAGWKALYAVTNTKECYHLLITDCNMPRLSGLDLIKRLRTAHIELPVVLATATLPEDEFFRQSRHKPAALLLKPYTIGELLDATSQVLHATCGHGGQTAHPANRSAQLSAIL